MRTYTIVFLIFIFLFSCVREKEKPFIKKDALLEKMKEGMEETVAYGPKPFSESEEYLKAMENKRKNITSEESRSFMTISSKYKNLKQNVSINFNNVEIKNVLESMGELGDINILIGEEVSGTVSLKLDNVAWDKAFQAVLDIKNFAGDFDTEARVIRIQSQEKLTQQYQFKSQMADTLSKRLALETSVEPVVTEMWRLFYITPAQAKKTLDDLFSTGTAAAAGGAVQTTSQLKITVEDYTRSIIVRGRKADLDIVNQFVKQIDMTSEQVLIEAFVVEASDDFERRLGSRLGAISKGDRGNDGSTISGTVSSGTTSSSTLTLGDKDNLTGSAAALAGSVTSFPVAGATSGIGVIRKIGATALKLQLEAMQTEGLSKTLSNPKIFTLNNQKSIITQGTEIPYQSSSSTSGPTTLFKEAALKLEVTPSIVGDGNVLIEVKVNNDEPTQTAGASQPSIRKMEINTKLLTRDGDIIVIGGIKKEKDVKNISKVPLLGDIPIAGELFKGRENIDTMSELVIFISARVIKL
ncbi:MAG: type IV pilus secretin PilQ [Pelagibacterales bacterium]|nr:type IV pilus secretin PilQ [Pelagibacterales bacterium]